MLEHSQTHKSNRIETNIMSIISRFIAAALLSLSASSALGAGVGLTFPSLSPAERAPLFELKDLNGQVHTLDQYKGQVLLVNFWATWCQPCRAEMPALERAEKALADIGVKLLAIDYGEPEEDVQAFAEETGTGITLLLDPKGRQARAWPLRGLPTTFIVNRAGMITHKIQGERAWDSEEVLAALRKAATHP